MKFLIAGLGNMDIDYFNTRHNIGFDVVDKIAEKYELSWQSDRYVHRTETKYRGKKIILIKPTTYMNLSGKAIHYWLAKEAVSVENLMVILDDLNLDFGKIRIKSEGSDGGHNGLKDISSQLGTIKYPRMRIGIGNEYAKGQQVNFVLGKWSENEKIVLPKIIDKACEASMSFCTNGIQNTMNLYNSFKATE